MSKKFYITTSIAYANAEPHVGFALESVQADVLARYHNQKGDDVFFLTGMDEYGTKIKRTAEADKKSPQEFVDGLAQKYRGLKEILDLSWNNFIRTTDRKNHWPVAQEVWSRILKNGDLYKKNYGGFYCVGCESFKTEKDIVDGKCVIHKKPLEFIEEENWFFKLSNYTKNIESKIKNNELKIVPEGRKNEFLSLLKDGLEDVSFSRSKKFLDWGVQVPNDENQVMYVWADALTNYISGHGGIKEWESHPADIHLVGKDISRFHCIIWPAMLMSAKLPLPDKIFIHGFVTANGEKISKSLGNVVNPYELVEKYGTDAVRYYLLREIPSSEDGDFTFEKFEERYNGDLANGLGNFAARILTLAEKEGNLPVSSIGEIEKYVVSFKKDVEEFRLDMALSEIWNLIHFGDGYLNEKKPWDKTMPESKRKEILGDLVFILNMIGEQLLPFMPQTAGKILSAIKKKGIFKKHFRVEKINNLFPRIDKK